jgi:hypothetical protein
MSVVCREDIWLALSELWLDTELDDGWLEGIAQVLRRSGLSRAQLEAIFLYEVAPVVWLNHWSVAGIWSAFDRDWLCAQCERQLGRGRWHRLRCLVLRWPMTYGCHAEWQQVLARL